METVIGIPKIAYNEENLVEAKEEFPLTGPKVLLTT